MYAPPFLYYFSPNLSTGLNDLCRTIAFECHIEGAVSQKRLHFPNVSPVPLILSPFNCDFTSLVNIIVTRARLLTNNKKVL